MGLFDFFKKNDKVKSDSAIDSSNLIEDAETSTETKLVKTKLSLHPNWIVPQEQKYVFSFLANQLAPLRPNQLSLVAIDIDADKNTGNWYVRAFFRSSLPQEIELGEVGLILLDKDNHPIASKMFDFKELGTIPPESCRPWVFTFEKEHIQADELPGEGWKLAFNLNTLKKHTLDLDDSWKSQLSAEQQEYLEKIVSQLPELKQNEVNFTGFQAKFRDDRSLTVSLFIRNGSDRAINFEQLPLEIIDANGKRVAKGTFKFEPPLTVQPRTTKPWSFIFPAELVDADGADLSRWRAVVPQ